MCIVPSGNNCHDIAGFVTRMNVFFVFRIAFTLHGRALGAYVSACANGLAGTGFAFRSFWDQRWLPAKRTAENRAHGFESAVTGMLNDLRVVTLPASSLAREGSRI